MTIRADGRRVISVTMPIELYDTLYLIAKQRDVPVTVLCREAIRSYLNLVVTSDETRF